jgi:hypothetical protein
VVASNGDDDERRYQKRWNQNENLEAQSEQYASNCASDSKNEHRSDPSPKGLSGV